MTVVTDAAGLDLSRWIKRGDAIVIGQTCGEPTSLVEALIAQGGDIGGLSVFIATSFSGLFTPQTADSFKLTSMGAIGALRTMSAAGKLSIIPCHVGQIAPMIEAGIIRCDVAMVQVSPADDDGRHSFGLIADHVGVAARKARTVIAEVNDRVPFSFGASLTANDIDVSVRVSRTPVEVVPAKIGAVDEAIARHCAAYIDDGCTLQIGVGAAPDALMRLIGDRKDLGIHTGSTGDGLVDLVEAGVVTNACKGIDVGVSIVGATIGTRRLFDFLHRNPLVRMCDASYTHEPSVLARLSRFVSVNSAIEVDLTGQVNAEASGAAYLGGTGGQLDYVRAGQRSAGGHAIVALPATAKGASLSRIVPTLSGPVTTARSEVDIIVTEYGSAELKGQTLAERARRMVAIAHPDFREQLDRTAHEIARRGY